MIALVPWRSGPYWWSSEKVICAWPSPVSAMSSIDPTAVPPISIWSPLTSCAALMKRAL